MVLRTKCKVILDVARIREALNDSACTASVRMKVSGLRKPNRKEINVQEYVLQHAKEVLNVACAPWQEQEWFSVPIHACPHDQSGNV